MTPGAIRHAVYSFSGWPRAGKSYSAHRLAGLLGYPSSRVVDTGTIVAELLAAAHNYTGAEACMASLGDKEAARPALVSIGNWMRDNAPDFLFATALRRALGLVGRQGPAFITGLRAPSDLLAALEHVAEINEWRGAAGWTGRLRLVSVWVDRGGQRPVVDNTVGALRELCDTELSTVGPDGVLVSPRELDDRLRALLAGFPHKEVYDGESWVPPLLDLG